MTIHSLHDYYTRFYLGFEEALSNMERRGILLDPVLCYFNSEDLADERRAVEAELRPRLPEGQQNINLASPKQLAEFLYDVWGCTVPPVKGTERSIQMTRPGERPTSEASLQWIADRDPSREKTLKLILRWKKLTKEIQFQIDLPNHLATDSRIHAQFAPNTETGRLSCKNPNLQQQPPSVREAFYASKGKQLICLDYSGLEWRILAHCLAQQYGDYSLVDDIVAGVNPHGATALRLGLVPKEVSANKVKEYNKAAYDAAKITNYSVNYGKSGAGLGYSIRDELGWPIGKQAGEKLLRDFYRAHPGIARFHKDTMVKAWVSGQVLSYHGRPRQISDDLWRKSPVDWGPGRPIDRGGRKAINVIQNHAADIVMEAMVLCEADFYLNELGARLVLQVHDELVFEVPTQHAEEAKDRASDLMKTAGTLVTEKPLECPLDVEGGIGDTWKEAGGK